MRKGKLIYRNKWKTREWKRKRHSLSVIHKRHHKMVKPVIVEPKEKADGPGWLKKKLRRNQLNKRKRNPVKMQELKISVIKQALKKRISRFLLTDLDSPLNIDKINALHYNSHGRIKIPANFSVTENPKESYETLQKIISSLLLEQYDTLIFDYNDCHNVELGTQVLQDIILKDFTI